MVELFMSARFACSTRTRHSPEGCRRRLPYSPHRRMLNDPTRDRTPWVDSWLTEKPHTNFEHNGQSKIDWYVRIAHLQLEPIGSNNEITRLEYKTSRITSLSLRRDGQARLRAIRLYCEQHDYWLGNLLSQLVGWFTGCRL